MTPLLLPPSVPPVTDGWDLLGHRVEQGPLDLLAVGGAGEDTILARVGEGVSRLLRIRFAHGDKFDADRFVCQFSGQRRGLLRRQGVLVLFRKEDLDLVCREGQVGAGQRQHAVRLP